MGYLIEKNILAGFNLTEGLMQKLFGEMDPHKKTYLTLKDWTDAFASFSENNHLMVELKNFMQCQFANVDSAWGFMQSFMKGDSISLEIFTKAVKSMIASRTLTSSQIKFLFSQFAGSSDYFGEAQFMSEFKGIVFTGKQVINPTGNQIGTTKKTTTEPSSAHVEHIKEQLKPKLQVKNATASKWESDVIEKLRRLIKSSGKSLDAIFK